MEIRILILGKGDNDDSNLELNISIHSFTHTHSNTHTHLYKHFLMRIFTHYSLLWRKKRVGKSSEWKSLVLEAYFWHDYLLAIKRYNDVINFVFKNNVNWDFIDHFFYYFNAIRLSSINFFDSFPLNCSFSLRHININCTAN